MVRLLYNIFKFLVSILLLVTIIFSAVSPVSAAEEYARVKSVDVPSTVNAGSSFKVRVIVEYSFKDVASIMVMIWDLEENYLASGDEKSGSWVLDDVSETGSKAYEIEVDAIEEEGVWNLAALVQYYTVSGEWAQSEGWMYKFDVEVVKPKPEISILNLALLEEELGINLEEEPTYLGDTVTVMAELKNIGSATAEDVYLSVKDITPTEGLEIVSADPPRDLDLDESRIWRVKLEVKKVKDYTASVWIYMNEEKVDEIDLYLPVSDFPLKLEAFNTIPEEGEPIYPEDTVTARYTIKNLGSRPIRNVDLLLNVDPEGLTILEHTPARALEGEESAEWLVKLRAEKEGEYTMKVDLYAQGFKVSEGWHMLTVHVSSKPLFSCMITTATFGSELSPEVSFLRSFRDGKIMKTFAGAEFIHVFNRWYYSFSPQVASFIGEHPVARETFKLALYPLIGILKISAEVFSFLGFNQELAVVAAGLTASLLIGLIYVSPLTFIPLLLKRRYNPYRGLKLILPFWLAGFLLITAGELSTWEPIIMAGTATLVLSTIALAGLILATLVTKISRRPFSSRIYNTPPSRD